MLFVHLQLHDLRGELTSTQQRLDTLEGASKEARMPVPSAVQYILHDPKYDIMPLDKAIPVLAIALAELYFGIDVLRESTLTGKNGCKLDYRLLARIDEDIKRKYSGRINMEKFKDVQAVCRKTIATRCKTIRSQQKPLKNCF